MMALPEQTKNRQLSEPDGFRGQRPSGAARVDGRLVRSSARIVFLDPPEISERARDRFRRMGAVVYTTSPASECATIARIREAELVTTTRTPITARVIDCAPRLRYLIAPSVGYEWIDAPYAASRGITVRNCPTHSTAAVAEHVFALLLTLSRRVIEARVSLMSGSWTPTVHTGYELAGRQLLLVGHGGVGRRVAALATAFGMAITVADSSTPVGALDQSLRAADVVCLCVPLTDQTFGLIDARRVALLKNGALLINVSRGAVVDEAALAEALSTGRLAGAGLDVFADESDTDRASETAVALARLPNVVATPHIAYNTLESSHRLADELYANILACLAGEPANVVAS